MGVPFYFKFLCKKYSNIILPFQQFFIDYTCDELYFDLNGLIHPCASKSISENSEKDIPTIESAIISEVKKEIAKLISSINPSSKVFLGVDGVAPFAKICQQRGRRYKSIIFKNLVNKLNREFKRPENNYDTNMISPGTPFMNSLMDELQQYTGILSNKFRIQVDLSSSRQVGEGEQKIIKIIRDENNEKTKIIIGLDADLIMLSLISGVKNINLLREEYDKQTGKKEFIVLNIDNLRDAIIKEINDLYKIKNSSIIKHTDESIIKDYIFLCYFIGNDFLPNVPMLSIDKGAINYLLKLYVNILGKYDKNIINDDNQINYDILLELLKLMSEDEDNSLKLYHNNYYKKKYNDYDRKDNYEKQLKKVEFMPLLTNTYNDVNFNKSNWRERYYARYFNTENYREIDKIKVYQQYLEGLNWILKYYTGDCPSWSWCYTFNFSPSILDLYNFLKKNKPSINFGDDPPLTSERQMACILPPKTLSKIPNMKNIIDRYPYLYPKKFNIEMLYKTFFHEAIPILPIITYHTIGD